MTGREGERDISEGTSLSKNMELGSIATVWLDCRVETRMVLPSVPMQEKCQL